MKENAQVILSVWGLSILKKACVPVTEQGLWRLGTNHKVRNFTKIVTQNLRSCSGHYVYGGGEGVHRVLVGKPEGKRPLGRPRRKWEDNINTLRTGDADLRFYITTVQDGWRNSAFLTRAWFPRAIHLITQYIGAFLRMVLLTDVYRNLISLRINDLW
jgi:hypothetical protein